MDALLGKWVKINRGGPDSIEGRVIAVKSDYFMVSTKNGVVYVAGRHIKSLSEISGKSGGNRTAGNRSVGAVQYGGPTNFNGVLRSFNQKFVQINGGGPEMVTGFVAGVDSESITLVNNRDVMRIPIYHIKSIRAEASNNKSSGNKNNNKSGGNKSGNKTGGNKSGNKSGGKY